MHVLDTDIFTHLTRGHPRVIERATTLAAEIFITVVTRLEQLQGRFDAVSKADSAENLLRAQFRLIETENVLNRIPMLAIDAPASSACPRTSFLLPAPWATLPARHWPLGR